ncbi:putative transposase [Alteromonadaceae bacterium 2753L.S.0a.02]|nr:putative transposase [Alteromonadaceae bacterium 2753L.S.0a.02]
MSRYRRVRVCGGTYFFTVNLLERKRSLLLDRIQDLRESLAFIKHRLPFHIDAWVVLPDHLHAVWILPEGDYDYCTRWREIKKRFSAKIPQIEYLSANRTKRNERGIWQRRFWYTPLETQETTGLTSTTFILIPLNINWSTA